MYQYNKRTHKHTKLKRRVIWISLAVLSIGIVYGLFQLRIAPKQDVRNPSSLSNAFKASTEEKVTFSKPELQFEATSGWKETPVPQSDISPRYVYKNVKNAQILEIYLNNPPQGRAVNKVVVVRSEDGALTHDAVSDNCVTFTDSNKKNLQTGISPAKWQQVDFLCDMANHSRAVVGAISSDGLNTILVTTASGKTYKLFFTYTDNNINPDYNTFYDILTSMTFR
ncbi:hypothetical protein IPL85_00670 [Candidatus Saccharibacteria bacterium]|nr:MAG: hypothetical protein IPL85_00670 [Candidatus Saccharibacteria bacterium]